MTVRQDDETLEHLSLHLGQRLGLRPLKVNGTRSQGRFVWANAGKRPRASSLQVKAFPRLDAGANDDRPRVEIWIKAEDRGMYGALTEREPSLPVAFRSLEWLPNHEDPVLRVLPPTLLSTSQEFDWLSHMFVSLLTWVENQRNG